MTMLVTAGSVAADDRDHDRWHGPKHGHSHGRMHERLFQPAASFDVRAGIGSGVSEIVDASSDGRQLVYTDAENGAIGFVNIANPSAPGGQGTVAMGGEPTSLVVVGRFVLVAVNTSPSFVAPSGELKVVNRFTRRVVASHPLGGQPDSIAVAPDKRRVAIVIENERDEDLNDGLIPQAPTGTLLIVDLVGHPRNWSIREADLGPVRAAAKAASSLPSRSMDVEASRTSTTSA